MSPRIYNDADGEVYACPGCDDASNVFRHDRAETDPETRYECYTCGARFGEPVVREPKADTVAYDESGIPHNLDASAAAAIRTMRGEVANGDD